MRNAIMDMSNVNSASKVFDELEKEKKEKQKQDEEKQENHQLMVEQNKLTKKGNFWIAFLSIVAILIALASLLVSIFR